MYKVVLDTNVLVSALWSKQGNPYKILEMFFKGEITLCYSTEIVEEYNEVLHREKLGFSDEKVLDLLSEIAENGIYVETSISDIPFIDEDDKKFYDAAKTCDAIVVTGNKKHYPDNPSILSPAEFIKKYQESSFLQ